MSKQPSSRISSRILIKDLVDYLSTVVLRTDWDAILRIAIEDDDLYARLPRIGSPRDIARRLARVLLLDYGERGQAALLRWIEDLAEELPAQKVRAETLLYEIRVFMAQAEDSKSKPKTSTQPRPPRRHSSIRPRASNTKALSEVSARSEEPPTPKNPPPRRNSSSFRKARQVVPPDSTTHRKDTSQKKRTPPKLPKMPLPSKSSPSDKSASSTANTTKRISGERSAGSSDFLSVLDEMMSQTSPVASPPPGEQSNPRKASSLSTKEDADSQSDSSDTLEDPQGGIFGLGAGRDTIPEHGLPVSLQEEYKARQQHLVDETQYFVDETPLDEVLLNYLDDE